VGIEPITHSNSRAPEHRRAAQVRWVCNGHQHSNGRLILGIFASIPEFERELIRGRVRLGRAAARTRGQRLAGRASPWIPRRLPASEGPAARRVQQKYAICVLIN
jgi:DNA invertase Pin-like site-specific DNA recombinase